VKEIREGLIVLLLSLEGAKTDGARELLLGSRLPGLSYGVTFLEQSLNVRVGSHGCLFE